MWPPLNIQALPSKEEIRQIKKEISSFELQLIEVQLKMEALQISISERKAWIAPIRKLPHDVLSQIFVEVSMDDWTAPLALQSVSRWWRDVAVGTPRAWTFIRLFECDLEDQSDLVSLFIERGRNVTLHIFAEDHHCSPRMKVLASRIECINLYMSFNSITYFIPNEYNFTRLERLQLHTSKRRLSSSGQMLTKWDMMQFPNIKSLELAVWDPILLAIAASPQFPSIRWLKIECNDPSPLTDILMKCAKSIESIDLSYDALPSTLADIMPTIHLPCLRYMQLEDNAGETEVHWRINGSTPNLEACCVVRNWPTIEHFKVDLCNVTFLGSFRAPDLSLYPRLITLNIEGRDKDLMEVINYLRGHPQSSPDLVVIEYEEHIYSETLEEAKIALLAFREETGRRVKLEQVDARMYKEREIHRGWVPQPCSEHMPCHLPGFAARRPDHF